MVYGGYTILEKGKTGLVMPVNKGVYANVNEGNYLINAPQFGVENLNFSFENNELACNTDDETKTKMQFVLAAINNTLKYLTYKNIEIKKFDIKTWNDEGLTMNFGDSKAGFGTSAGATVSTVSSVLAFHNININTSENRELINKIAQYTHYLVQGKVGSGFDVSCACFGPHFFTRADPLLISESKDVIDTVQKKWDTRADAVKWPSFFRPVMVYTGRSASTKGAVKKVRSWRENNEQTYQQFISENDEINKIIIPVWNKVAEMQSADDNMFYLEKLKGLLETSWAQRKKIGMLSNVPIETHEDTTLLKNIEINGAFCATMPGAGGGDSILCIALSDQDADKVKAFCKSNNLYVFDDVKIIENSFIVK